MWKFNYISITQIFSETKVGDLRRPKTAILTHLRALIFDFDEFLYFLRPKIYTQCQIIVTSLFAFNE